MSNLLYRDLIKIANLIEGLASADDADFDDIAQIIEYIQREFEGEFYTRLSNSIWEAKQRTRPRA